MTIEEHTEGHVGLTLIEADTEIDDGRWIDCEKPVEAKR